MNEIPSAELAALIASGKAPAGARTGVLDLTKQPTLTGLPAGLQCHTLRAGGTALRSLPADLSVSHKLDLTGCESLEFLPANLKTGVLVLRGCVKLQALPEGLDVDYLDISDCRALSTWPASVKVHIGNVTAPNCTALTSLPTNLGPINSLDIRNCTQIKTLPDGVNILSWIDFAGTGITQLPDHLQNIGLRWRGVAANRRIVLEPETLTTEEILAERNAEVRRVMIERVGLERFLAESKAETLHEDTDPGGARKLYRLPLPDDEDLVCVSVNCPSTGRHYLIRVPPAMKTCHQAVAWTAGFDNPADYAPLVET
ncbi:DUF6745 domain-containing protein [Verrucomicrobium sp. BvORR034]|uniref:DUF6745 domain-containing protein n=1 Tax=Verrucomicrobium sp. BvORR034 TaxID=1396418 RepID=UPI00067908B8|nr:hypothetical protein [Verrucomicrobium sp. BvORR034]